MNVLSQASVRSLTTQESDITQYALVKKKFNSKTIRKRMWEPSCSSDESIGKALLVSSGLGEQQPNTEATENLKVKQPKNKNGVYLTDYYPCENGEKYKKDQHTTPIGEICKEQGYNYLLNITGPELLQYLESFLGDNKWLVGKSVTWADFYWDVCSTTLLSLKPDMVDNYPKLQALKERVQAFPGIAAWIQERPKTML